MKNLRKVRERRGRRLPPSAVAGSIVVHAAVVLAALITSHSVAAPSPPQMYRVELVAAADPRAPVQPDPQPPEVAEEEHRPPPPEPQPERRRPETERPTVVEETPRPEPEREPARADRTGEEAVNVQLDGAVFAFPAYLENIIRQVERHWRPPTGGRHLRAEIVFVIREDGSVSEIQWKQRSGDPAFDMEARGAIEAAGRNLAFGPLPEGYPLDRLRVSFFFDPTRR